MANIALKRIQQDLRDIFKSEKVAPCGIRVKVIHNSFYDLKAEIAGPPDTPYEGGKFVLLFKISSSYPFKPPKVRFLTKVWHVNISCSNGYICLDVLQHQWTASLNLRTILLSIQVLLSDPVPDAPKELIVAKQCQSNLEMFNLTARHWTYVYARGPYQNPSFDDKIKELTELGYSKHESIVTLSVSNWDLEYATKRLISNVYTEEEPNVIT